MLQATAHCWAAGHGARAEQSRKRIVLKKKRLVKCAWRVEIDINSPLVLAFSAIA